MAHAWEQQTATHHMIFNVLFADPRVQSGTAATSKFLFKPSMEEQHALLREDRRWFIDIDRKFPRLSLILASNVLGQVR